MSRNKRFITIILGAVLVFTLTACSATPSAPTTEAPSTVPTSPPASSTAPTEKPTQTPSEATAESGEQVQTAPKILIAYYSKTGNTKTVADIVTAYTGGDYIQVVPVIAYPESYNETIDIARKELDGNARPEYEPLDINPEDYDIIFLGYPNWWGTLPMTMFTFLESYDFSGKTIIPFCTHAGSGLGRSEADLAKLLPSSTLLKGLAVSGSRASGAKADVEAWIDALEIIF